MSDVLMTHSYFLRFDPKEHRAMMPYAPLGTLYGAAILKQNGYSVLLADSMLANSENHILPYLKKHRPPVFVLYDDDFNYLTKMCLHRMRRAALNMIRMAKQFCRAVIVHGSDSTDHAKEYIESGADYIIKGEAEITLLELVKSVLSNDKPVPSIPGLVYATNGVVKETSPRKILKDLDSLPFPARELVDWDTYRSRWIHRHNHFSMNVVTTRGCPFHCTWCAKPLYGQVYHSRTPENVAEEFLFLKKNYAPDHIWICDDIFGLKPGWIQSFTDEIRQRNAQIPFKCLSRVDLLLRGDTIPALKRAGCETVWVGAESGSQKILDAMEKGTTVEQIYTANKKLQQEGIRTAFFIQYGYPGETSEDIEKTIRMIKDCKPDQIGISVSYPLPGTKFFDSVSDQLSEKTNWEDSQDLALLYRGTFVPDFYRTLHTVTHSRHRISLGFAQARSVIRNPAQTNKKTLRSLASAGYHIPRLLLYSMILKYHRQKANVYE